VGTDGHLFLVLGQNNLKPVKIVPIPFKPEPSTGDQKVNHLYLLLIFQSIYATLAVGGMTSQEAWAQKTLPPHLEFNNLPASPQEKEEEQDKRENSLLNDDGFGEIDPELTEKKPTPWPLPVQKSETVAPKKSQTPVPGSIEPIDGVKVLKARPNLDSKARTGSQGKWKSSAKVKKPIQKTKSKPKVSASTPTKKSPAPKSAKTPTK
jgi:hypothetical protein